MKFHWLGRLCVAVSLWLTVGAAHALTPAEALTLASGDSDERIATLNRLATAGDEKGLALIQALSNDAVKVQGEQVLVVADDGNAADAVTGAAVVLADDAEDAVVNNRMRAAIEAAMAMRQLFGEDVKAQRDAAALIKQAAYDEPDASQLPMIDKALAGKLDERAREDLDLARAAMLLASDDEAQRLTAVASLGERGNPALRPLMLQRMEAESSESVKAALKSRRTF